MAERTSQSAQSAISLGFTMLNMVSHIARLYIGGVIKAEDCRSKARLFIS